MRQDVQDAVYRLVLLTRAAKSDFSYTLLMMDDRTELSIVSTCSLQVLSINGWARAHDDRRDIADVDE